MPPLHGTVAAGHAATYALHLAARHPGILGRLALLAPTWRGPLPTMAGGDRPLFGVIRRVIGMPVLGPLLYRVNVNQFVVGMMVGGHVYSDKNTLSGDRLTQKRRVIDAQGARYGSAAFVTGKLDRIASRTEFLELARGMSCPLLVMYGAETPPKSRTEIEALAALAGVQSAVTPFGKLGFYEEFAEQLIPILATFLI